LPRRPERINPVAQGFGAAVRRAREERDETLEDVAGRVPRLDPRYLGEIELGWHAPTIVTVKRLADALDTPLADLVDGL
jgi:transcriptional regulator with XRE-family HTH domain